MIDGDKDRHLNFNVRHRRMREEKEEEEEEEERRGFVSFDRLKKASKWMETMRVTISSVFASSE